MKWTVINKKIKSNLQNKAKEYQTEAETDNNGEEEVAMVKKKQSDERWERVEEKHDDKKKKSTSMTTARERKRVKAARKVEGEATLFDS
jgi:hypothetical protein